MDEARERRLVPEAQVAVMGIGTDEIESLRSEMTTRDGRSLVIRPVRPTDESMLREAFYKLSPESVYKRFFSHVTSVRRDELIQSAANDQFLYLLVLATNVRRLEERSTGTSLQVQGETQTKCRALKNVEEVREKGALFVLRGRRKVAQCM